MNPKYIFISKALYIPEIKTLAIGDLHLGYEFLINNADIQIPYSEFENMKDELKKIIEDIKKRKMDIKTVVFLGDIKHFFAYKKIERDLFVELIDEIGKTADNPELIVIKGNHEKRMDFAYQKLLDFYVKGSFAFIHGDVMHKEILSPEIEIVVMGHLHPAIALKDSQKIKSEKYKCFLAGKYLGKEFIILPSFGDINTGTSLNEHLSDDRCFIPPAQLLNFEVHAIGEDNQYYNFGKLGVLEKLHDNIKK